MATLQFFLKLDYFSEKILKKVNTELLPGFLAQIGFTDYTTLHYTTLHYTTLHYTTLHYTTLHHRFLRPPVQVDRRNKVSGFILL